MKIELFIDGEMKLFTVPFVPMLAKRKYFEHQVKLEQRKETPSTQTLIDDDDEVFSILTDVVFGGRFTIEQLLAGASKEYVDEKLTEAVFGIKTKKADEEGNKTGK